MKKQLKLVALTAAALGLLSIVPTTLHAHADNQFYSVPNANQDVQQVNSGNVLADYSDNDLNMVNNTVTQFNRNKKYIHTSLNMKGNNPLDTYPSTDGSNSFSTYFYLPEGFHVQYGEHGNYQSTVLVGNNLYIVESMGTGKNQGAIIKYNLDDLKNNGIFDGNQDLIWKALKYFSPYTVSGNRHSADYLKQTADIDSAKRTIASSKKQVKISEGKIKPLKSQIKRLMKPKNAALKAQKPIFNKIKRQQKALDNQANYITKLTSAKHKSADSDVDSDSSNDDSAANSSANSSSQKQKTTTIVSDVTNDNYAQFAKKQPGQIKRQNAALKKLQKKNNTKKIRAALNYNLSISRTIKIDAKTAANFAAKFNKANSKVAKKQAALDKVNTNIDNLNEKIDTNEDQLDALNDGFSQAKQYAKLAHLAQISPLINIGHGQTLSYNPANKHLYLAQDDSNGDQTPDQNDQVTELDSNSLQPIRQYTFKLLHNNTNFQVRTLTFDSQGNAYIGRNYSSKSNYQFLKGQFTDTGVSFATERDVINRPGYFNQGISYNAANNRMYIISDDALTSLPLDELNNGTVNSNDLHYLTFNTSREFEDVTFDQQGNGYLLMLWKPEILKSASPLN